MVEIEPSLCAEKVSIFLSQVVVFGRRLRTSNDPKKNQKKNIITNLQHSSNCVRLQWWRFLFTSVSWLVQLTKLWHWLSSLPINDRAHCLYRFPDWTHTHRALLQSWFSASLSLPSLGVSSCLNSGGGKSFSHFLKSSTVCQQAVFVLPILSSQMSWTISSLSLLCVCYSQHCRTNIGAPLITYIPCHSHCAGSSQACWHAHRRPSESESAVVFGRSLFRQIKFSIFSFLIRFFQLLSFARLF